MKKSRLPSVLMMLVTFGLSPFAHASIEEGAHEFKQDVKSAAHSVGHGAKEAGVAIGHGAKQAGHAVADASKKGYHATKNFVTGKD